MRLAPAIIGITTIWAALVSCQTRPGFWVVPGSTVDNLVFGVSERKGIDSPIVVDAIYVYRGRSGGSEGPMYESVDLIWAAVKNDNGPVYPLSRIRYGDIPKGLNIKSEAQPLNGSTYYQARVYFKDTKGKLRAPSVTIWISEQGLVEESILK